MQLIQNVGNDYYKIQPRDISYNTLIFSKALQKTSEIKIYSQVKLKIER